MSLQPQRMLDNLHELQRLTGDENGAQRVAWTPTWQKARDWLAGKLAELPVKVEIDEAGNTWATLPGVSPNALVMGSHIDSVVNGGWLDGCLGVVAGLEVLRHFAESTPAITVRLVSWADEEGTGFGHSLLGASLATGQVEMDALRQMKDKEGTPLPERLAAYGVNLDTALQARRQLESAAAYLELHIEQGPVLERLGLPLAAVVGALGVERHAVRFTGQTAHAGSTPMDMRRDALAAAARLELALREIAVRNGGVATLGSLVTLPGIVTAVVGQCDCQIDLRNLDGEALACMYREAREASQRFAAEEDVTVEWSHIYHIAPTYFDPRLTDLAASAVAETGCPIHFMPSGPLHDAVAVARYGIPTAMLFVQSLRGLSHTRVEDTRTEHLLLAVQALDRLARKITVS